MMKTIFYIAVFFILVLSTGCQNIDKLETHKDGKSTFYGEVVKIPKNDTILKNEFTFATYILQKRDHKARNEALIRKISYQNINLFYKLQKSRNSYFLPKDSMIFLPRDLYYTELKAAKGDIHYFNTGLYKNRKREYIRLDGKVFDQNKSVDLYNQTLIEYKSKMSVKASGRKTKVHAHPNGNLVLQSVNKKKIHYNISFNHPTKIENFYYVQPKIKVNGLPREATVWTYKICINGSCKNSFYYYDDDLDWQENIYISDTYNFDKRRQEKRAYAKLDKRVKKIYVSIDNYRSDIVATPGYVELESDYSFSFKGLSEEATVVGNLQKRQDKTLNEDLIRQIAIDNPQLFRYVQNFHKTFHVSRTSLSHLPKDVSISYALKHSADIYATGRYKDKNNRHKKWHNSKRRLGTSTTKYHSKHKVKVTGKSTVKIKKSRKKKTSKYIDFSQGI